MQIRKVVDFLIRFIGDVSNDGRVRIDDISGILRASIGISGEYDIKCADLDGDGSVIASDEIQALIKHLEAVEIVDGFFDTNDIITNEVI